MPGTRLSRWSDDAGNETGYLHVREVDDDGRFTYEARFDADDFDSAYRELETLLRRGRRTIRRIGRIDNRLHRRVQPRRF